MISDSVTCVFRYSKLLVADVKEDVNPGRRLHTTVQIWEPASSIDKRVCLSSISLFGLSHTVDADTQALQGRENRGSASS
jgi:hypothetical protein